MLAGAALLLAGAPATAVAREDREIVLRGSRTASTVVRFAAPFAPDVARPVVSTRTYAGVWFEHLATGTAQGFVVVDEFTDPRGHRPVLAWDRDNPRYLPAGRYRVTLIAGSRSIVRLSVAGLRRDLALAPATRVTSGAKLLDVRSSPDLHAGQATVSISVRKPTVVFVAQWVNAPGATSTTMSKCFERRDEPPCPAGGDPRDAWVTTGAGYGWWWIRGDAPYPEPGDHDVTFTMAVSSASPPVDLLSFALTFG
jgi:hypothetical protein